MVKELKKPVVICFGEILWDNLPQGRKAGGAPMNVAYHLNTIGAESKLISRVGNDLAGTELLSFCSSKGLPNKLIQTDEIYPTGEVNAKIMDNHEVVYDILSGAAWDYISLDSNIKQQAAAADAFVYGSLAARNPVSRATLLSILESAKFKVFDVNIRAPHYTKETLTLLLNKADLLKLNSDELDLLGEWFYKKDAEETDSIKFLQQAFDIPEIIITKGSDGASFYNTTDVYHRKAYPVKVADTVGAGDSFLAAFLYKKLTGEALSDALDYALGMGAFIASQSGACPAYTPADLEHFIVQQQ